MRGNCSRSRCARRCHEHGAETARGASAPYRAAGHFAYHFARAKLTHDPVFEALLAQGLLSRRAVILDLGCGQGLLAALLLAARAASDSGAWPVHWPPSPQPSVVRGIELVDADRCGARNVRWGAAPSSSPAMCAGWISVAPTSSSFSTCCTTLAYADQRAILERAHRALTATGVLLLRVADAAGGVGFALGKLVDRLMLLAGGCGIDRLHCRTAGEWRALLSATRFDSEIVPMSGGTPFANVLIVAKPTMNPLLLKAFTAASCIGLGLEETRDSLARQRSGLKPCAFETVRLDTHVGEVAGVDAEKLPGELQRFDCRNNRLAERALRQDGFVDAVEETASRRGRRRIGVFIGTSTSGILETELAYRSAIRATGALAGEFRLRCDSQLVLGRRLPAQAPAPRRPGHGRLLRMRIERQGVRLRAAHDRSRSDRRGRRRRRGLVMLDHPVWLSLAAAVLCERRAVRSTWRATAYRSVRQPRFALLERVPGTMDGDDVLLLGVGESSDAYHMSAPHPEGHGARRAMQAALVVRESRARCDRLHQPARNGNAEQRSLGKPGRHQPVRPDDALQFDEGRDRPYARSGRCVGSGHQCPGAAKWLDARRRATPHASIRRSRRTTSGKIAVPPLRGSSAIPSASAATNCSLILGRAG